ncbi:MAG TPA: hydroxyisourate hydrolase [Ignavibacteria bacterium]|nr:hydroxyisourate hydrolase [Ignavibacteria bacterium]
MSKITTHVLDTSRGKPAIGIRAILYFMKTNSGWGKIGEGITNTDGRITDLLQKNTIPEKGIYKINFETGKYFTEINVKGFYPFVEIVFEIDNEEHYHIPLLLGNFGYSTYRGS